MKLQLMIINLLLLLCCVVSKKWNQKLIQGNIAHVFEAERKWHFDMTYGNMFCLLIIRNSKHDNICNDKS